MFTTKLEELDSQISAIRDPLNYYSLGVALAINIIHAAILYFKLGFSQTATLIHYNVIYGSDLVGQSRFVYIVPLAAFAILLLNICIASYFYRREKLAAYFLNFSNVALQLIFLVISIVIILAND
jgi:hypothetical protein